MKNILKKHLSSLIILFISFLILLNTSNYTANGETVTSGAISIVFDDNYGNQLTNAWPLMEDRDIIGTFYVLTNTVNTPGYMGYTDLQTLQAAGNEIGTHSVTHTSFTDLNEQQIRVECFNSKTTLEEHGLVIKNFAYPNGETTSVIDGIVDDYYVSGRTAYISPFLIDLPTDQFRLPAFSEENQGLELNLLKNMVDQVYSTNSWGIFLFHNILPGDYSNLYTTSQEDFESFLDYVMLKELPTLTVNQGLDLVTLTMDTTAGMVSPLTGEYTSGSDVVIEAVAPVAGDGERFFWEGWSGSGVGSYSGTDNPATITMNEPLIETASWNNQFNILLFQNGVGSDISNNILNVNGITYRNEVSLWLESGSILSFSFEPELTASQGKKYLWTSSSGLSNQKAESIIISKSGTITANYLIQYYVNIISNYSDTIGSGWYSSGDIVFPKIDNLNITESENERYAISGWFEDGSYIGGTSDPIIINNSISLVASWQKQYLFVFNQKGLPDDLETFLIVNSENQRVPL